jgi:photosystem II stability/assembly factor-like uncharacterized protein
VGGAWSIERVSFLGDAVSLSFHDARAGEGAHGVGVLYAALYLGHFGAKLRRSFDLGATWEECAAPAFPPLPEGETSTLPDGQPWPWRVEQLWSLEGGAAPGELWCGSIGGGLFRSRDRGQSWSLNEGLWHHPQRKEWFGGGAELPGIHSLCVHPRQPRSLAVAVSCGGVWQSDDDGHTWRVTSHGMFAAFMPPERKFDPVIQDVHQMVRCEGEPNRLWAQHHNGVFRSDDGGHQWTEIPNVLPSVFGFGVAVHPQKPDTAWLVPAAVDMNRTPVNAAVVVARTRDAGRTWDVLRDGLPQEHAYDLTLRHGLDVAEDGQTLAFGSTTGSLWLSDDEGEHWQCLSTHLPPIYAVRFADSATA